jgi:hypothetical protein
VQRERLGPQRVGQLAVAQTGRERHLAALDGHGGRERLEAHQFVGVGDVGE